MAYSITFVNTKPLFALRKHSLFSILVLIMCAEQLTKLHALTPSKMPLWPFIFLEGMQKKVQTFSTVQIHKKKLLIYDGKLLSYVKNFIGFLFFTIFAILVICEKYSTSFLLGLLLP